MIEHMNSECDCRVDGHHIGYRCLPIGLWGHFLIAPGGSFPCLFLFVICARVNEYVDNEMIWRVCEYDMLNKRMWYNKRMW